MLPRNATLAAGDKSLGPVLDSGSDLTITFQMFSFTMAPAIFLILVTAMYIHKAIHNKPCVQSGRLLWAKLAFAIALAAINVTNLVLWSTSPTLRTDATLAATALDSAGSLCIIFLVYSDHLYSLRPSTFVSVFLSITILLDAVETRSYFRRHGMEVFGGLSIGTILVKIILLSLEEVSKRRLAKIEAKLGKEAVSGFWNRSLFVWLNSTLLLGFRKVIKPEELQDMDPEFRSELLYGTFAPQWEKSKSKVTIQGLISHALANTATRQKECKACPNKIPSSRRTLGLRTHHYTPLVLFWLYLCPTVSFPAYHYWNRGRELFTGCRWRSYRRNSSYLLWFGGRYLNSLDLELTNLKTDATAGIEGLLRAPHLSRSNICSRYISYSCFQQNAERQPRSAR
jgi:hypothetical protein